MSEAVSNPPVPKATARSRAFTREVWIERVARFPASGLTPAQFCALEAVSLPSFYSWKRRLAAEATPPQQAPNLGPRLLPVRLAVSAAVVELVLPSGAILRLPTGSDLSWVRSLVAALGEPSC
jgi:hypothetical protein